MHLKELSIINFKNYADAEFIFSDKINAFVGDNGAGKTNILEAIYYLSFTKSYSHQVDLLNIKEGEDFFLIKGNYIKNDDELNVSCGVKRDKKKSFKKNNKEYKKISDHIGLIPLVMISPSDYQLISGASDERRRFIDSVISQYDRQYLEILIKYNKAVQQRNKLLKQFAESNFFDKDLLSAFDDVLINSGNEIFEKRTKFITELVPVFQKYYKYISGGKENVSLEYKSALNETNMQDLLTQNLQKDRISTYTTGGIHKDDLLLNIGNFAIKKSGSQGQQKTFLIALKLAQFDFMSKINGLKPILLFDDIFDKLDSKRVEHIISLVLDNNFGQIFMTDANKYRIDRILSKISENYKVFEIENGKRK